MSKDKAYKPKIIAIEIGDAMFDAKVHDGLKDIPEKQSSLKKALLNSNNPIFKKFEDIYKSGAQLTDNDRDQLKAMIEVEVALLSDKDIEQFKNPETKTGSHSSDTSTHYCYMYQALHNGRSIEDIIQGYNKNIGLNDRFTKQFERDFINGMRHKVINQNGDIKYVDLNSDIKTEQEIKNTVDTNFVDEFRKKVHITDEQLQYLKAMHNQKSDAAFGVMLSVQEDGQLASLSSIKDQETILNVEERDGELFLKGITHRCIAGHRATDENGETIQEIIGDAKVALYVDLSQLTGNRQPGEKEFLPIPSQKVTKILTYEPLNKESEYSLPDCLKHRTLDKVLAKAIENGDRDKVTSIINNTPEVSKYLSKKTINLYSLYKHDSKGVDAPEAHDVLLSAVIESHQKPNVDSTRAAKKFTKQMFQYLKVQNNFQVDKNNIPDTVVRGFLDCQENMKRYLDNPTEANLKNAVEKVNAMSLSIKESAHQQERRSISPMSSEFSRSNSGSSLSSDGVSPPPATPQPKRNWRGLHQRNNQGRSI